MRGTHNTLSLQPQAFRGVKFTLKPEVFPQAGILNRDHQMVALFHKAVEPLGAA